MKKRQIWVRPQFVIASKKAIQLQDLAMSMEAYNEAARIIDKIRRTDEKVISILREIEDEIKSMVLNFEEKSDFTMDSKELEPDPADLNGAKGNILFFNEKKVKHNLLKVDEQEVRDLAEAIPFPFWTLFIPIKENGPEKHFSLHLRQNTEPHTIWVSMQFRATSKAEITLTEYGYHTVSIKDMKRVYIGGIREIKD